MYQMSAYETGEVTKSENTATWVFHWLQFELFNDFNSNCNA